VRVIVTGSRDWPFPMEVYRALTDLVTEAGEWLEPDEYGNTLPAHSFVVVHGDCPTGADSAADDWCISEWVKPERHPADWNNHGKAAGFIRNKEMVDLGADLILAFQKNKSKGTQHTIDLARKAGIEVRVYER
jgi:hypothetical protein